MSHLDELVNLIQSTPRYRETLALATSRDELLAMFLDIIENEGLYVEESVIEAAILAAEQAD